MESSLELIVEELKQLKKEGTKNIYIQDSTLNILREWAPKKTTLQQVQAPKPPQLPTDTSPTTETAISLHELMQGDIKDTSSVSTIAASVKSSTLDIAPIPPAPELQLPSGTQQEQWDWLRNRVLTCPTCQAHVNPGKQIVFGVGNINADIFFCGEAPGADEETQGEPFVGPAGQLLTKMIGAMGLKRSDVYIGNIMNWRPETGTTYGNRPPTQEEMMFCLPYLQAQVTVVKPKVIVALGSTAVNGLLGHDSKRRMGQVRGNWFSFNDTPLMITFHPSYVLRNNTNRTKRMVWEDLLRVMEKVSMPISDKQRSYFL